MTFKVKKINIQIASFEQVMKDVAEVMIKIKKGERVAPEPKTLSFPDIATLNSVLTPERIRILQTITEKKPKSINELTRQLGRKYANVFCDVKKLKELGLLELREDRNKTEPTVDFTEINIQIPLKIRA